MTEQVPRAKARDQAKAWGHAVVKADKILIVQKDKETEWAEDRAAAEAAVKDAARGKAEVKAETIN